MTRTAEQQTPSPRYVRFESAVPSSNGRHHGVFALANRLAHEGRLTDDDRAWWRASNDWFNEAYLDPATVDATVFDPAINPGAECWFKREATHLTERVAGYLDLLDRYDVWHRTRRSDRPGRVVYEDEVQVVVVPDLVESG